MLTAAVQVYQDIRVRCFRIDRRREAMGKASCSVAGENPVKVFLVKGASPLHAAHCRCIHGGDDLHRAAQWSIFGKKRNQLLRNIDPADLVAMNAGGKRIMRRSRSECVHLISRADAGL